MAITFIEQAQRQKKLIIVFAIVILITVFILWRGYFAPKPPEAEKVPLIPVKKIEINFEVLKNPILNELQSFEKMPSAEEAGIKIGRENPFIPY